MWSKMDKGNIKRPARRESRDGDSCQSVLEDLAGPTVQDVSLVLDVTL